MLHPCHPVRKCNNVRDLYELQDFLPPNSLDLNPVSYKIWALSIPEKAQDVNDLRRHLIDVRVGVKQWRKRLHAYIQATKMTF